MYDKLTTLSVAGDMHFYKDGRDKDFDLWYQLSGFLLRTICLIAGLRAYKNIKGLVMSHPALPIPFYLNGQKDFKLPLCY